MRQLVQQLINGISLGSVYAMIAVGYALIVNVLKFSNFSHGAVMTMSAYLGYFFSSSLKQHLPPVVLMVVCLLFCACMGAILAVITERVAFRRLRKKQTHISYYFVSSITMGILLENLINIFAGSNFYSFPFGSVFRVVRFEGLMIVGSDLMMFIIASCALVFLMFLINKTKFGLSMRVVSLDSVTAGLMGINVNVVVIGAFLIAGLLGGLSGVFLGINYTLYPQLGKIVVKGFIASIVGGLGSISGAIIGAMLLGVLEILLIGWIGSSFTPVCVFLIMLAFLVVRPQGISGKILMEKA